MEMRASEDVGVGQDLTPQLQPLAFSLHDSSLLSHCSACFSLLSPPPHQFPPLLPTSPLTDSPPSPNPSVLYCSPLCSEADSDLHLSSAEHHLLHSDLAPGGNTSDLRSALRLLLRFERHNLIPRKTNLLDRIGGLMSNRNELMHEEQDGYSLARIKGGAKAMAMARRMRDNLSLEYSGECALEEAVLCVVLTNAVEVQVNGGPLVGIAVYDMTFSWINHSCSPNACYTFPLPDYSCGESRLRILRAATGCGCSSNGIEGMQNGGCDNYESMEVSKEYGPRIVVRSIKAIKKFEEVSIAYIDLLQPKALRHSELWSQYRFICSCQRCSISPPTYVDHTLQEISAVNCSCANLSSDHHHLGVDEEITRFSDYVDDAIAEYLKFGNPKSSCEKLENLLVHGLSGGKFETEEEKRKQHFCLHPLHHLSLTAYTTLASAYKTRASDLLAVDPEVDKLQLEAFATSRTSAAYSLLLAGATNHLFLFESSLVASAATFWILAGESLLSVARSPVWKLFAKEGSIVAEIPSCPSYKCCNCTLVDKFGTSFDIGQARDVMVEDLSREFLSCVTRITPKVWAFLINKGCFLKLISDPIDFKWIGRLKSVRTLGIESNLANAATESTVSTGESGICVNQENISLFQLGVHCLRYGGILSTICFGKRSYLDDYLQNLLYG
ncbi:hypothetical protein RHMOL_Rhmol05G0244400 [Rhododendron molle]|uniref:Uncharacterized protein n=2 Tax=Rhododendron molle TaxID=49168 RepID=A0ACC0NSI8_RHOML|nr:hypothetical protein RHMOL_Rhmol05G0244400 [Rhododendron molle]